MHLKTIDQLGDIAGKYVLLRDDFNVQIVDGKITDAFRIEQSLPTIRRLREMGARVAIVSHLGRPKGMRNMEFTLAPVALKLSELLGEPVPLVSDCIGTPVADARRDMQNGNVVLLENVRFHPGEEANDAEFSHQLATGFDIFVNDAFAVSHRAHASTVGVTEFLPAYAGELLAHEIETLSDLFANPKRPVLGIIAGAKVSSKVGVIKSLVKFCDKMILGGGIGNAFKSALGANTGKVGSNIDTKTIEQDKQTCREIMKTAAEVGCEIILGIDKGTGKEFTPTATRINKTFDEIVDDDIIMDEGPQTIKQFEDAIASVKTVIWNGPVGLAEWPNWNFGTFSLARYIAERTRAGELESIVGGGDVVAALHATHTENDMTYVSTGGGAFLEFVEGIPLPGIKVLEAK